MLVHPEIALLVWRLAKDIVPLRLVRPWKNWLKMPTPPLTARLVPRKPGMVAPSGPRAIALLPGPRVIVIKPEEPLRMLSGVLPVNFSWRIACFPALLMPKDEPPPKEYGRLFIWAAASVANNATKATKTKPPRILDPMLPTP